jgi:hypothetical protein
MIVFIQFIDAGDLSLEIVAPLSRGYLEKSLFRFIITKKNKIGGDKVPTNMKILTAYLQLGSSNRL